METNVLNLDDNAIKAIYILQAEVKSNIGIDIRSTRRIEELVKLLKISNASRNASIRSAHKKFTSQLSVSHLEVIKKMGVDLTETKEEKNTIEHYWS